MARTFGFALIAAALPAAACAAGGKPELSYALGKTRVSAAVSQRITQCPPSVEAQSTKNEKYTLGFEYTVLIEGKSVPSRLVTVDPSSGFLVDRTTKMTFNEDGLTLKDYNAMATGQGGPVIVGLIKAAATIYGLTANPLVFAASVPATVGLKATKIAKKLEKPEPVEVTHYYMVCRKEVVDGLTRLDLVDREIAALEAQAARAPLTPDQVELLTNRRTESTDIKAALTLDTKAESVIEPMIGTAGLNGTMSSLIKPADFTKWFEVAPKTIKVDRRKIRYVSDLKSEAAFTVLDRLAALPAMIRMSDGSTRPGPMAGRFGYEVKSKLDAKSLAWFSCGPHTNGPACTLDDSGEGTVSDLHGLVYRRPVSGVISVEPLDQPCAQAGACVAALPEGDDKPQWIAREKASKSAGVKFPQLSRLFVLPTGASIFGSRTVGATFDTGGTPTMLQFDKGGSGKDAASILDASAAAAQSVSGARLAATKTRIDELESAKKLHDLLEPDLAKPE